MTVKSGDLVNGQVVKRKRGPKIGLIPAGAVETAFLWLLYAAVIGLVVLSFFGTFYGFIGKDAPLAAPWLMAVDAWGAPGALLKAFGLQMLLTLAQWAARLRAVDDRRWWFAYLAALAPSVYYNIDAYFAPALVMGVPIVIALILIIAGDIIPELVGIRRD